MSGLLDSALFRAAKPLVITTLQEKRHGKWYQWMVDDPPHWEAMKFYAERSSGHVLTTGLGLGLVLHSLALNPEVKSVTVIERSQDVIDLIGNQVPACNIVLGDFYEFLDTTPIEFDTCIIDLWVAHDVASKLEAYKSAIYTYIKVRERWPKAKLFFHGFATLCDELWLMSEETKHSLKILAEVVA